jgi:DNA repair protein RadC
VSAGNLARLPPEALADDWTDSLLAIANISEHDLGCVLGLPADLARRLAAALELHRRLTNWKVPASSRLDSPQDAMVVLAPMCGYDHERFWVLPLNITLGLIASPIEISRGDVNSTDARPRMVFRPALRRGATSIIIAHNHPTGDVMSSSVDLALTIIIVVARRTMDLPINDHFVIAADRSFCSIRREYPACFR